MNIEKAKEEPIVAQPEAPKKKHSPLKDHKLGDQHTTLEVAKQALAVIQRIAPNAFLENNPTWPSGTDYVTIDENNIKDFAEGEYVFNIVYGPTHVNVDLIVTTLLKPGMTAKTKAQRILLDLGTGKNWFDIIGVGEAADVVIGELLEL